MAKIVFQVTIRPIFTFSAPITKVIFTILATNSLHTVCMSNLMLLISLQHWVHRQWELASWLNGEEEARVDVVEVDGWDIIKEKYSRIIRKTGQVDNQRNPKTEGNRAKSYTEGSSWDVISSLNWMELTVGDSRELATWGGSVANRWARYFTWGFSQALVTLL